MQVAVFDLLKRIETVEEATEILGPKKVVTAKQAATAWGLTDFIPVNTQVKYTLGTLMCYGLTNNAGYSDWRLIYILPLSLYSQREIIGTHPNPEPCFSVHQWWLVNEPAYSWARRTPKEGYYLLNFTHEIKKNNWRLQQREIDRRRGIARVNEHAYFQSLISIYRVHADPLYRTAEHWGENKVGGARVLIDYRPRNFNGLRVNAFTESTGQGRDNYIRVPTHVMHKPEF